MKIKSKIDLDLIDHQNQYIRENGIKGYDEKYYDRMLFLWEFIKKTSIIVLILANILTIYLMGGR